MSRTKLLQSITIAALADRNFITSHKPHLHHMVVFLDQLINKSMSSISLSDEQSEHNGAVIIEVVLDFSTRSFAHKLVQFIKVITHIETKRLSTLYSKSTA